MVTPTDYRQRFARRPASSGCRDLDGSGIGYNARASHPYISLRPSAP